MNTRRGFFARFGLAIGAIIAAPKMAFQIKRQSKPFMYDPTKYMGEIKWMASSDSPWLNIVRSQKFPENQGLTISSVYRKV